ncbi:MAG: HD domain-containing protein [Candidatus Brocadiaceae bacterium]|nr:HD domain-containing protein [Candidatus Brocadiaceae bacterium]
MRYVAISKDALVEDTKIGCDLFLRSYVNGYPRYVLFCRGDEYFGSDRKGILIERSIQKLYVLSKEYRKFFKYQEKNLPNIITDNNLSTKEKSHAVYYVAKSLTKEILEDIGTDEVDLGRVKNWVKYTMSFILNDENAFSGLISMTSHDYYTYTHSINLSVLGLLFGKHLRIDPISLNAFGIGMLLHDVGKVEIPIEILNKPDKLTKEEYEVIKRHPETGHNLLKDKQNIEEISLLPAIQHHENYNGTGYPHSIGGSEIDLFGRLSRIIDVYDAITTRRCYTGAMTPFDALNVMREEMVSCFDTELFMEFICFLGPKGTGVIKQNGKILNYY